jgi:hypothetical protein
MYVARCQLFLHSSPSLFVLSLQLVSEPGNRPPGCVQRRLVNTSHRPLLSCYTYHLPAGLQRGGGEIQTAVTQFHIGTSYTVVLYEKVGTAEKRYSTECFMTALLTNKQTPWPLVHKRTIPTEDRQLSAKFSANFCG